MIGNIICTFKVQLKDWEGILPSSIFAIWSTVRTTRKFIPPQLVFGMDTILNINQGSQMVSNETTQTSVYK